MTLRTRLFPHQSAIWWYTYPGGKRCYAVWAIFHPNDNDIKNRTYQTVLMLVVLFIIISFAASMTISVSACPEELLFFLVALFGFGFLFFSFINMVYVIIIIANYFLHMNYQTMHCSKQTHIKGFCTSMTFGFKPFLVTM